MSYFYICYYNRVVVFYKYTSPFAQRLTTNIRIKLIRREFFLMLSLQRDVEFDASDQRNTN